MVPANNSNNNVFIPENKDKDLIIKILANYITSNKADEIKVNRLHNSYNEKIKFQVYKGLLDKKDIIKYNIQNSFVGIEFYPHSFFEINEWHEKINELSNSLI